MAYGRCQLPRSKAADGFTVFSTETERVILPGALHDPLRAREADLPDAQRQAPFTASLKALPAVNLTVFAAAILISAPVAGLRPVRPAR